MRLLVFTDSRGQHKPAGQNHLIFGERLKSDPRFEVSVFLCPMKWTTTLDFIEQFSPERLAGFDSIILYTGIVDWSPRPQSNAIRDLYDNPSPANGGNLAFNTNDYTKKVVNNKKSVFDAVFGEPAMRDHLTHPFDTFYDGEPTVNMYGLEMARRSLVPKLAEIPNLIFISANRIVEGWRGDYRRDRPSNMAVTHSYSDLFASQLGSHLVDLRAWTDADVKRFTCDNIHLTEAGSNFIFGKLLNILDCSASQRIISLPNVPAHLQAAPKMKTSSTLESLIAANRALREGAYQDAFHRALKLFQDSPRSTHFHTALRAALSLGNDADIEKVLATAASQGIAEPPSNLAEHDYLKRFQFLLPRSTQNRVIELAKRSDLSPAELLQLENRLLKREALRDFVDGRCKLVRLRMADEFRHISRFPLPFPYNYLGDYAGTVVNARHRASPRVKSVTFIYPIKDRARRALVSLRSLARAVELLRTHASALSVDVVLAEDESADLVPDHELAQLPFDCTHRIVKTGVAWTRSGLINQGIKSAKGQLLFFTDADVLFPPDFLLTLAQALDEIDMNRHVLAVNMFETHTHTKEGRRHSATMPYSYMWGVLRKHASAVGGFSENYVGWGSEDRDFEYRVCKKLDLSVLSTMQIKANPFVLHLSHDVRTGAEAKAENKDRLDALRKGEGVELVAKPSLDVKLVSSVRHKPAIALSKRRPELFLDSQGRRSKTLIILGNGPSLREIMEDPKLLDLIRTHDSFGLNAAYRAYERFGFYPTYFGSFDYRVCDSHADNFAELVAADTPIKRFFFAKQSVFPEATKSHPKFQRINFQAAPRGVSQQPAMSKAFDDFQDCGSSGTNAVQAGYLMGYRRFILLGVDCNYVELLDGVKDLDGIRYEVVDEIGTNPNYWFDDYQRKGDQFHKPNEKDIQLVSWAKLDSLLKAESGHVANCSLVSKLPMYDILPFSVSARRIRNVLLVISCQKYRSRIDKLRAAYDQRVPKSDLVLYVVGGSDRNYLGSDGVLHLRAGDHYEDLPQKVQAAIEFCAENLDFERLIKVDDDVFIDFNNFYPALDRAAQFPYVGRRTPTRAGITPSSVWHFGKVSEGSFDADMPHDIEPPPEFWAGGGMYMLSREAAACLAGAEARCLANYHLYEDYMVGDVLARQGVTVTPWNEIAGEISSDWCVTNLQDVMDQDLGSIKDPERVSKAISVHCGSYPPYYRVDESKLSGLLTLFSRG